MEIIFDHWRVLTSFVAGCLSLAASGHAILRRRDPRASLWWATIIWLLPFAGAFFYVLFGINRVQRKAIRLRSRYTLERTISPEQKHVHGVPLEFPSSMSHLREHELLVRRVVQKPLLTGNSIRPLIGGDIAFREMIDAIDSARTSIGLCTYIFVRDRIGEKFIEALIRAKERGVDVRVLIDDVGSGFSWRSVYRALSSRKIAVCYFLPTLAPYRMNYLNLRNHRKILTIDGKVAFTGGMNITENHDLTLSPASPAQDIHFRLEGPVVAQIQEVFQIDWLFTSNEHLDGNAWFPALTSSGKSLARAIADGPDEDFERCRWAIGSALSHAKSTVYVVTPYLIPDATLIAALNMAAMSGVSVNILLPSENDMALVEWASQAMLWQVLQSGCKVWRVPPPFNHTKLMVVDRSWVLLGSTNWDTRSLRLNFEFNVECYDSELAASLERQIDVWIKSAHEITFESVGSRPFPVQLRNGLARLFAPLL